VKSDQSPPGRFQLFVGSPADIYLKGVYVELSLNMVGLDFSYLTTRPESLGFFTRLGFGFALGFGFFGSR
jgi:hypothetical protein